MTARRIRDHLLGASILAAALLYVWWWAREPNSGPRELADAMHGSNSNTRVDAHGDPAVASREVGVANLEHGAGGSEGDDVDPLILVSPPDTPPEPPNFRPEFTELLLRAAETNGRGTPEQACEAWSRVLALALDDEASDDERKVAYLNVEDACRRESDKPRSSHDLRLAHETLVRHAQEYSTSEEPLVRFLAKHPEFTDTRAALLVANQHPPETIVTLDQVRVCSEPCTVAVPVDGKPHQIGFSGPGVETSMIWSPSSPDASLPQLK